MNKIRTTKMIQALYSKWPSINFISEGGFNNRRYFIKIEIPKNIDRLELSKFCKSIDRDIIFGISEPVYAPELKHTVIIFNKRNKAK